MVVIARGRGVLCRGLSLKIVERQECSDDGVRVHHKLRGVGLLLSRDEHELAVPFDPLGYRRLNPAVPANGLLTIG